MAFDIVVGRYEKDREKLGLLGTVLIGKQYIQMGRTTSLANNVYLDIARSHIVLICGKRGGGKSYSMGVIAEGMAMLPENIKENLSFILLDTMGIYWTMKYPNKQDEDLLAQWGMKGQPLDIRIFTPYLYHEDYKKKGIPTDRPFSINADELDAPDWQMTFDVSPNDPVGVLLERIVHKLRQERGQYTVDDMIDAIRADDRTGEDVKGALENRFISTKAWGVFAEKAGEGTQIHDLAAAGEVTVLDVSCYATMPGGWRIKHLIVGLVSQKLFLQRMLARKDEEYQDVHAAMHYFTEEKKSQKLAMPLVWLVIDEAHEFLPHDGKNPATDPLVTIMREGRQPGISLILATQQPGKIHTDAMTQSDTVISHRITARMDVDALGMLTQSYMREGLTTAIDNLPRVKGAAVLFDDTNERLYAIHIRPRVTWHGGEAPLAVKRKEEPL